MSEITGENELVGLGWSHIKGNSNSVTVQTSQAPACPVPRHCFIYPRRCAAAVQHSRETTPARTVTKVSTEQKPLNTFKALLIRSMTTYATVIQGKETNV